LLMFLSVDWKENPYLLLCAGLLDMQILFHHRQSAYCRDYCERLMSPTTEHHVILGLAPGSTADGLSFPLHSLCLEA
jgi:hypothetical protein